MDRPPLAGLLPPEMTELRWRPLMTFFLDINKPYVVGEDHAGCRPTYCRAAGGLFRGRAAERQDPGKRQRLAIGARQFRRDDQRAHSSPNRRRRPDRNDLSRPSPRAEGENHRCHRARRVGQSEFVLHAGVAGLRDGLRENYGWLNRVVSVAHGHRLSNGAIYNVFDMV